MRQCLVNRSRRVNAAPHRHEYGFSLVSKESISYMEVVKSGLFCGVQTGPEVAGQMFCTLEAPGAMAAGVGESVHMFAFMCFMSVEEMVGGVVGVLRAGRCGPSLLPNLFSPWLAPTPTPRYRLRGTQLRPSGMVASRHLKRHATSNSVC
jgi:hypothetical protein